tara:strand:+ start:7697 stop:8092 length:396 start_codon:yes stop_codon:yes gene_type:complete
MLRLVVLFEKREIFTYLFIGGGAFIIDASILEYLINFFNVSPQVARFFSAMAGVLFIWIFNRTINFSIKQKIKFSEVIRIATSQSAIFLFNYIIFVLLFNFFGVYPLLSLVIATSVSMVVNFLMLKLYVFK